MPDPFDVTNSDAPAADGGISPNAWQNLMTFGAGGMANSNLPGATAFGKGILAAQQGSRENSVARSENNVRASQAGLIGAQAASTNMGNQMNLFAMNMLRQHYGQSPLTLGPNGQLIPATDQGQQGIKQYQQQQAASAQPSSQADASSQPRESQGMTGASWAPTPGTTRLNSGAQTNAYPAGSSGEPAVREASFMPPNKPNGNFAGRIAQAESGNRDFNDDGTPVTSSKGAKYAMQVMPSTARDPGYGVRPAADDSPEEVDRVGRDYAAAMQAKYGNDQMAAAAYNAGPGRVDQALQGLPQETQDYVSKVAPSQTPGGQQPAGQNSDPFAAPKGVDKAQWDQALLLNQMGNPYGKSSLEAMARAPYTTIDARQGGIAYNPGLGITAVGRLEGQTPGGAKYLTPPNISGPNGQAISGEPANQGVSGAGGVYSGVPQGSVLTDIGPGAHTQIEDAMRFHADGEHGELKSFNAAQQATQNIDQLSNYLDTLNKSGGDAFLQSGAGADWRNDFAKGMNSVAQIAGAKPVFQPDQIASAEGAYKMTNLLGMQMISQQFGASREAGNVIMTGIKSNPSIENTPMGAKMLVNGIREVNNNTIDRYTFKDWWARPDGPHPGDLRNADVAFNQLFSPQSYAQRAISQEQPIKVNTPAGRNSLLPGTIYIAPDGSTRNVPQYTPAQLQQKYLQSENSTYTPALSGGTR